MEEASKASIAGGKEDNSATADSANGTSAGNSSSNSGSEMEVSSPRGDGAKGTCKVFSLVCCC